MSCTPLLRFRCQEQHAEEIPRDITFPGIAHLFGEREPDRPLCQVRALTLFIITLRGGTLQITLAGCLGNLRRALYLERLTFSNG